MSGREREWPLGRSTKDLDQGVQVTGAGPGQTGALRSYPHQQVEQKCQQHSKPGFAGGTAQHRMNPNKIHSSPCIPAQLKNTASASITGWANCCSQSRKANSKAIGSSRYFRQSRLVCGQAAQQLPYAVHILVQQVSQGALAPGGFFRPLRLHTGRWHRRCGRRTAHPPQEYWWWGAVCPAHRPARRQRRPPTAPLLVERLGQPSFFDDPRDSWWKKVPKYTPGRPSATTVKTTVSSSAPPACPPGIGRWRRWSAGSPQKIKGRFQAFGWRNTSKTRKSRKFWVIWTGNRRSFGIIVHTPNIASFEA